MIAIDRAGARIIGGQSQNHLVGIVLVAGQQIAQILRAAFGVFLRVFRVDAESAGGIGHKLHEAEGAFGGLRFLAKSGFDFHHAAHERFGQRVFLRGVRGEFFSRRRQTLPGVFTAGASCAAGGFRRRRFNHFFGLEMIDRVGGHLGYTAIGIEPDRGPVGFVPVGM